MLLLRIAPALYVLLAGLAACSPALEWRNLALPELGIEASLPCKPERAERSVELAGQPAQVLMHSCEAGGATFAVACAPLAEPSRAGAALRHWRAAVLAAAQAGTARDTPFLPAGALDLPQSVRTVAEVRAPDGSAVQMQAAWFARVRGDTVQACHAMVYARALPVATADVFFGALALR